MDLHPGRNHEKDSHVSQTRRSSERPNLLPGPRTWHAGHPVRFPGWLINGLPAARLGDTAGCGQTISGAYSTTVFINGKNAATLGSTLSHGGVIIGGSGDVLIGDTVVAAPFITPSLLATDKWISFQIPAVERYSGWRCVAHFDDGSRLDGIFNSDNRVAFSNPSGSICTRVEIPVPDVGEQRSVTDKLLSIITGSSQG